ncbi:MAG: 4Fe-4S dicluster domain-containing protein [Caldilineaceae bacterium]|nr:4Fe-4S dicluster domain-containing protein [Caldilineaceae bacterium]
MTYRENISFDFGPEPAGGQRNQPRNAEDMGLRRAVSQLLAEHQVDDVDVARIPEDGSPLSWDEIGDIFQLSPEAQAAVADAGESGAGLPSRLEQLLQKPINRRDAIKFLAIGLVTGLSFLQAACTPMPIPGSDKEQAKLNWEEYFKGNYRLMSDGEKQATVERLERRYELRTGDHPSISNQPALPGVLYGYAFNISKCRGYMDCVEACIQENNQDRSTDMRYIRIHEMPKGEFRFEFADDSYLHEVPAAGHFYVGTQCFHCENPPCVNVCPVKATWKEDDGLVVVDYDWCIGCRYCQAACPYDGRRFNWKEPVIPQEEVNLNQHYLGNRLRKKGVMEKCTFCIQRSRGGKLPACVEACPTGARIFGNLLDPESDIRWVLENKKVFRLKEDLGTEPKFWYFMD